MNCQDMEKFIHVYLDREFAEEDRSAFERHLSQCEHCRRLASFERKFKHRLRSSLRPNALSDVERQRLQQAIHHRLTEKSTRGFGLSMRRIGIGLIPAAAAAGLLLWWMKGNEEGTKHRLPSLNTPQHEGRDNLAARPTTAPVYQLALPAKPFPDEGRLVQVTLSKPGVEKFVGSPREVNQRLVYYSLTQGRPTLRFHHGDRSFTVTGDFSETDFGFILDQVVRRFPSSDGHPSLRLIPATQSRSE